MKKSLSFSQYSDENIVITLKIKNNGNYKSLSELTFRLERSLKRKTDHSRYLHNKRVEKYNQTEKGKTARNKAKNKYRESENGIKQEKEYSKRYYKHNSDERKEYSQKYRMLNPESIEEYQKNWRKSNPEYNGNYVRSDRGKEIKMLWKQSKTGRLSANKSQAKRRRNLGYNPINNHFEDSEGHHLNEDLVMYIPKELHKSVSHSVLNNRNMKEINDASFEWLCTQEML